MAEQPTSSITELGTLVPCEHCSRPTYDRSKLPATIVNLPAGFTRANARHRITLAGKAYTVCEQCRYDVYGAW